jgi:hypothetical protein
MAKIKADAGTWKLAKRRFFYWLIWKIDIDLVLAKLRDPATWLKRVQAKREYVKLQRRRDALREKSPPDITWTTFVSGTVPSVAVSTRQVAVRCLLFINVTTLTKFPFSLSVCCLGPDGSRTSRVGCGQGKLAIKEEASALPKPEVLLNPRAVEVFTQIGSFPTPTIAIGKFSLELPAE